MDQGEDPIGDADATGVAAERATLCELIGQPRRVVQPTRVRTLAASSTQSNKKWGPRAYANLVHAC